MFYSILLLLSSSAEILFCVGYWECSEQARSRLRVHDLFKKMYSSLISRPIRRNSDVQIPQFRPITAQSETMALTWQLLIGCVQMEAL